MSQPVLVFDMDGVLADVTESYRETIARTVEHFTGAEISPRRIQDFKNRGGFNDDWQLTHHTSLSAASIRRVWARVPTVIRTHPGAS